MDIVEVIRIIFGSIFVLFLPGLSWSFLFFNKNEIDWVERIALSFGLSIALVPLTVFWLNYLFKIKINLLNVSLTVATLIVMPIIIKKFELQKKTVVLLKSFYSKISERR